VRELRSPYKIQRRFVLPDVLEQHGLASLPLPEPRESPKLPDEVYPSLIRRVHGTPDSIDAIVEDIANEHTSLSRAEIKRAVNDTTFSTREVREPYKTTRRFVLPSVRFDLSCLVPLDPDSRDSLTRRSERSCRAI
jgi:hypothetical protein